MDDLENIDNEGFRKRFQASLGEQLPNFDEFSAAASTALWQRLEPKVQQLRAKKQRRFWGLGSGLITLAAASVVFFISSPSESVRHPADQGRKGNIADADLLKLVSLRFAIVDAEGQLTPGHDEMTITIGTRLVFAVEARNLVSHATQLVELSYRIDGAASETLLSGYKLRSDREIMTGEQGYYSFIPKQQGWYSFILRKPRAKQEYDVHGMETDDEVGFRIKVLKD